VVHVRDFGVAPNGCSAPWACRAGVAVAPRPAGRSPQWQGVAFEDVHLRLTDADRELASVVGCHPFDNPLLPVVVGVNRIRHHQVEAGAIIVTNSSTSFFRCGRQR